MTQLRIFIFIQSHDIILNSNIPSFTQYATDFNFALELRINKIEGEELILSVDGDCQFPFRCFYVVLTRVRTGPGKPGKSWNFILAFSRAGKSWKKATGPGKYWKSVKLD